MARLKTLREVCDCLGISRRVIQGYESHGLVSSCAKNKYGYLLYDEETIQTIRQIRLYQQLGFTLNEIEIFQTASSSCQKATLEEKMSILEIKRNELSRLIELVGEMILKM